MLDKIHNSLSSSSNKCLTTLVDSLISELGFTTDEINSILTELTDIFNSIPSISDLESIMNRIVRTLKSDVSSIVNEYSQAISDKMSKDIHSAHEVYNAENSIKIPEQIVTKSHDISHDPIDIDDADYTTDEHYPYSSGEVDPSKNWSKIDQKINFTEHVHSSGSYFKIDRDGNASIHITGNLKLVVNGDITINCKGSTDTIIDSNNHIRVKGEKIETIHSRVVENYLDYHITDCSGERMENSPNIYHNSGDKGYDNPGG